MAAPAGRCRIGASVISRWLSAMLTMQSGVFRRVWLVDAAGDHADRACRRAWRRACAAVSIPRAKPETTTTACPPSSAASDFRHALAVGRGVAPADRGYAAFVRPARRHRHMITTRRRVIHHRQQRRVVGFVRRKPCGRQRLAVCSSSISRFRVTGGHDLWAHWSRPPGAGKPFGSASKRGGGCADNAIEQATIGDRPDTVCADQAQAIDPVGRG